MTDRDRPPPPIPPVRPAELASQPVRAVVPESPQTQTPSAAANEISAPAARDRIVILGRRGSGKTIYLARLYEALWQGCKLANGQLVPQGTQPVGGNVVKMSCRSTSGPGHAHLMGIAAELRAGKWPSATAGNSYTEIVVTNGGREHVVTALDFPGEVFRKAFMLESDDSDAAELRSVVDRAAAAILLIDPSTVAGGGEGAQEDVFGLTQAALRIRKSVGGELIPIAIVFTKADVNGVFLKEAGGVRKFAAKHFGQLLREIDRASVFPCAAVRTGQNALGKSMPRADKAPENVVEPLRYCLDFLETGVDIRRSRAAQAERAEALRTAEDAEHAERRKSSTAWVVFAVAVTMLLVSVGAVAFWFSMKK